MRKPAVVFLLILLTGALSACANPAPKRAAVVTVAPAVVEPLPATQPIPPTAPAQVVASGARVKGIASWYRASRQLDRTYTGELMNNNAFTAASTIFPMGTMVRVERVSDGRSVVVRVNDRMPHNHRIIDLTEIAARELGMMGCGVANVTVTPIMVASVP